MTMRVAVRYTKNSFAMEIREWRCRVDERGRSCAAVKWYRRATRDLIKTLNFADSISVSRPAKFWWTDGARGEVVYGWTRGEACRGHRVIFYKHSLHIGESRWLPFFNICNGSRCLQRLPRREWNSRWAYRTAKRIRPFSSPAALRKSPFPLNLLSTAGRSAVY